MPVDDLRERFAEDVLHDDPLVAARVGAEVVEVDEVGVLEVEAVGDAAQFDVGVAAEELERDFLAAVADGEVDLAEPALADAALDRVAVERSLPGAVGELHRGHRKPRDVRCLCRCREPSGTVVGRGQLRGVRESRLAPHSSVRLGSADLPWMHYPLNKSDSPHERGY